MIDVVKLINTFEDSIYHFIDSDMYCICYDDGKDKRLMINYGLFPTEEACLRYINSINNSNLIAYNIKVNKKSLKDSLTYEEIQDEISYFDYYLQYFHKMELIVINRILEDIDVLLEDIDVLLFEETMNGRQIIDFILDKYKPLVEDDLIDMIPNEYDKLIRYNVPKKQSIESYDKDSDVASE